MTETCQGCPKCLICGKPMQKIKAFQTPTFECPGDDPHHNPLIVTDKMLDLARATRDREREKIEASLRWVMARVEVRPRNDGKQAWCRFCPGFWPMGGQEAHDKDCGYARARARLTEPT